MGTRFFTGVPRIEDELGGLLLALHRLRKFALSILSELDPLETRWADLHIALLRNVLTLPL
jgi:hypothetical protein